MMVVMHSMVVIQLLEKLNCPLEVQLFMKILNSDNKLQYAVYNHLLKFVLLNCEVLLFDIIGFAQKGDFSFAPRDHLE